MTFHDFFEKATKRSPYPYQERFATRDELPELLNVPTGVGKTATAILGWLYRRRFHEDKDVRQATPRRLVFCLPMRVLVEQTAECAEKWLDELELSNDVRVHLLMGGTDNSDWDEYPQRDAILVGTQDMLLSRALNRGYGMSRYRWPVHFGLLNNDCLWVMDETQLMGVGLTTTAQLHGLRAKLQTYGVTHSVWMSATLDASPLNTVDHPEPESGYDRLALDGDDRQNEHVRRRLTAVKTLRTAQVSLSSAGEKKYAKDLAAEIRKAHRPGALTLVVLNRVARAQETFQELQKAGKKDPSPPELALIHARFRPCDRRNQEAALFSETMPEAGRIVVATQAIEAGVDVSARTLFTELAPWSSLVQRFGRCNREGKFDDAEVLWIDVQLKDDKDKLALPYDAGEYAKSREFLKGLKDVGPAALAGIRDERPAPVVHTLRRKDLLDLWDTTPDLAGNDLDVSRFIREGDDTDVQFYWREYEGDRPPADLPGPAREELCAVRLYAAREFVKKSKLDVLAWNPLNREWMAVRDSQVRPGQVQLLKPAHGGYSDATGWTGDAADKPLPYVPAERPASQDAMDNERTGNAPVSLTQHLIDVAESVENLQATEPSLPTSVPWESIVTAARWHDVGKSHPAFQKVMQDSALVQQAAPNGLWAKSGGTGRPDYCMPDGTKRPGFRHELASAIAWLTHHRDAESADLVAFLIASHHGKVRASLRSLPNETVPVDETLRFARGIWDGDELPPVDLGNGESVPATVLSLALMELGDSGEFGPSWLARVMALRETYGPLRLSYLESLLRVADWRGSELGDNRNA